MSPPTFAGAPPRPWRVLDRRLVLSLPPRLGVALERVALPDGRIVEDYVQIEMPSYATIYAETADRRVLCLRQYKHGPRRVSLTLPAGHVEPQEDARAAAERELLEETGYVAAEWRKLATFSNAGNQGCGQCHVFAAYGARAVQPPRPGDLEEMRLDLLPHAALGAALRGGDIAILGSAIAAALGLADAARRRARLRRRK
ncbi:MAG TPA: NUDIX hydrolase [Stellaceae bacterium]|nr:NUDIX hydrolase [Stellaceae bacterium]